MARFFSITVFSALTSVVFLFAPVSANSQGLITENTGSNSEDPETSGLSLSASVTIDEKAERVLREIETAVQSSDELLVGSKLAGLFQYQSDGLAPRRGSFINPRSEAVSILSSLSEEGLDSYQRVVEVPAEAAFQRALQNSDLQSLQRTTDQFPKTQFGDRALQMAISTLRDRGEFRTAELVLAEAIETKRTRKDFSVFAQSVNLGFGFADSVEKETLSSDWRPSVIPAWEYEETIPEQTENIIEFGIRDLREHGLAPLSPWTCVPFADRLVVSNLAGLKVLDQTNGKIIWERSDSTILQFPGETISRMKQLFGESLLYHPAVRNSKLFIIENTSKGFNETTDSQQIVCLDSNSGEIVWSKPLGDEGDFCSPPAIFGDEILVVIEKEPGPSLVLMALDQASGDLVRELSLGKPIRPLFESEPDRHTPANRERVDRRRRNLACPIVVDGHLALCPTGAGLLVAVNLTKWEIEWAYRYPRADVPKHSAESEDRGQSTNGFEWWAGWQRVEVLSNGDSVVLASPESNELHCLDRRTGTLRWKRDRRNGQYIGHLNDNQLLIIGTETAESLGLSDGSKLWSVRLNCPSGFGVVSKNSFFVPDSELGWTKIDLLTGEASFSQFILEPKFTSRLPVDLSETRNFFIASGEMFEVSRNRVRKLQAVDSATINKDSLTREANLLRSIELDQMLKQDWRNLYEVDSPHVETLRRSLFQKIMKGKYEGKRVESLVKNLVYDPQIEVNWFVINFEDAIAKHDWDELTRLLIDDLTESMLTDRFIFCDQRKVRVDRLLVAELQRLHADLNMEDQRQLIDAIEAALAHQGFDQPNGDSFLSRSLRQISWLRSIQDVEVKRKQDLNGETLKGWSRVVPTVNVSQRPKRLSQFELVPLQEMTSDSLGDWSVALENPGLRKLRFFGPNWSNAWDVVLPSSRRTLQYEPDLLRGWKSEDLLVLQRGTEIFGIAPFDKEGNPGGRVVWPQHGAIDTLGDRPNSRLSIHKQFRSSPIGFSGQPTLRLNEFGQSITSVGPVRANYFCFQQKGMLVVCETATGRELWRRYGLDGEWHCFGNDHSVVVIDVDRNKRSVFDAVDGRLLNETSFSVVRDEILIADGIHVLVHRNLNSNSDDGHSTELQWIDLVTLEPIWNRTIPTVSIPFEFDRRRLGIVGQDSQVELIDVKSGKTFSTTKIRELPTLKRIVSNASVRDCLVIFSGEVDDPKLSLARQFRHGFRRPMVNGKAVMFSRAGGEVLWERELENTVFPLDQPQHLPIFVTAESRFPESAMDNQSPLSLIRVYDRTTAELLHSDRSFNSIPNYEIDGDREAGTITLNTRTATVTLTYRNPSNPTSDPAGDVE